MYGRQIIQCFSGLTTVTDAWNINYKVGHTRLHYVLGGGAELECGRIHRRLLPGQLWLLPSSLSYSLRLSPGETYRHLYFDFLLTRPFTLKEPLSFTCTEGMPLTRQLETAVGYLGERSPGIRISSQIAAVFLDAVLSLLDELIPLPTVRHDGVERALLLIHRDYAAGLSVPMLAAEACMEESAFHRAFRSVTGIPPHRYLREYRLRQGNELLHEDRPVREVALSVGFSDVPAFTAAFRRFFGFSPGSVRKGLVKSANLW